MPVKPYVGTLPYVRPRLDTGSVFRVIKDMGAKTKVGHYLVIGTDDKTINLSTGGWLFTRHIKNDNIHVVEVTLQEVQL